MEPLAIAQQHHAAGRFAEAERLYVQVLEQQPDQFQALYLLGLLAHQRGDLPAAIARYQAALAVQPELVEAQVNLGVALQQQGKLAAAIGRYQMALRLQPNHPTAQMNLGIALQQQGNWSAAAARFGKVLQQHPNLPDAHTNLAHLLKEQGDLKAAIAHYRRALVLQPQQPEAYQNLGDALQDQAEFAEAINLYDQALRLDPQHVTVQGSRIRALLISGDLQAGFAAYDPWRLRLGQEPRSTLCPTWDGSPLAGQPILLYAETGSGMGDTLQFIRYAPLVADRGGRVIVECQASLVRLLQRVAGIEQVIAMGEPLPPVALQAALLSLPHILGTTLETIPATVPYLRTADCPDQVLPPDSRPKVGIVWGGNPEHVQDASRSCPVSELRRFLTRSDIAFYSLQKGPHHAEITALADLEIHDLHDQLTDFDATATAIAQLDLVISVDTSVAHLAGGLAKPIWVLLSFAPDWRWLMQRPDSPWYPTMRLFRQTRRQDWAGVCDRVATHLDRWITSKPASGITQESASALPAPVQPLDRVQPPATP